MELEFDFDKIKELPEFLAQKVFWVTIILMIVVAVIGLGLGYKYVYLVSQTSVEPSGLVELNQDQLQQVLERLEQRQETFEQTSPADYNLFE